MLALGRLLFVIFGGLTVLQTSDDFGAAKALYLGGTALALVFAVLNMDRARKVIEPTAIRSLLWVAGVLYLMIGISALVSLNNGIPATRWLRDVASLLLFASVPFFAMDIQTSEQRRFLVPILAISGAIAALSFTIAFLGRRHLSSSSDAVLGLPSPLLAAAFFSYASAAALLHRRQAGAWTLAAVLILFCLLFSATRSTVLLLVSPLAMAFLMPGGIYRRVLRVGLFCGVAALCALVLVMNLSAGVGQSKIMGRLATVSDLIQDPSRDQSLFERVSQTISLLQAFNLHPIVGTGPGEKFQYFDRPGKLVEATAVVDSPMVTPAKFGLVGVALLLTAMALIVRFLRRLVLEHGLSVGRLALAGYMTIVSLDLLILPPYEDKGFSLGLLLLVALSLAPGHPPQSP